MSAANTSASTANRSFNRARASLVPCSGDQWPPGVFAPPFFSFSSLRKKRIAAPGEEKKENLQNRKCIPCRHRVRRSQLHSVSAGAAKTPYPQPSSSFPNCDRFTGSQFGHLEFYNAARYLDDGGQKAFYEYRLWGRRKVEVRPVNRKNRPGSSEPGRSFYRCVPRKKIDTTPGPVCAPMTGPT